ncbi:MAG: hypothetical protein DMG07_03210, partial [Acidobacteria bacterium]
STGTDVPPGVAITSLSAKSATVRLELWDSSGRRSDGVATMTLAAYGHAARYLFQIFPSFSFTGFSGTLRIVSTNALISVAALQLGSQSGQFTALPVKPLYR